MIDESVLKSNFIGRDGFRWWIGQIAPVKAWEGQANGSGWGRRYKVRILGYHPYTESELSNEDLPWAGVLLPSTSGSGAANYAVNPKLRQGDVVVGFFLDGDNGQVPMIMGTFGRTDEVPSLPYTSPFVPFTGYTNNIQRPNGTLVPSESSEDKTNSQKSPRSVSAKQVQQLNSTKETKTEISSSKAIGQVITFADTCDDNFVGEVTGLIENLLSVINEATDFLSDVSSVIEKIKSLSNNLVGTLFNSLYNELIPLLQSGLELLYKTVFAQVLAATANPAAAHLAGVAAQKTMVGPVKALQDSMTCIASNIIKGLTNTIRSLVESTIMEVVNFGVCNAEQFVSSLLNGILEDITSGLDSALGAVSKILSPAFTVADFLRSSINTFKSIGGLFDCNQDNKKCVKLVKKWTIGYGSEGSFDLDKTYEKVLENMNISAAIAGITTNTSPYTKPDCNVPSYCGAPTVTFFGGDGFGATGKAILGNFISNNEILADISSSVSQTASIIGVEIEDPGSGYYTAPPLVSFNDECNLGYGAIGRAIVDYNPNSKTYGQVKGVYVVSGGENYPAGSVDIQLDDNTATTDPSTNPYGVVEVYVVSSGFDYSTGDVASDNIGNTYSLTIDNGKVTSVTLPINSIRTTTLPRITINSSTGSGAILKPLIGKLPITPQGEVAKVIDCIT